MHPRFWLAVSLALCVVGGARSEVRFACRELPFVLNNDASQERFLPETVAGGLALLDADGDGDLDIYFTNGASLRGGEKHPNALFLNDGRANYTRADWGSALAGSRFDIGVAAADFDGDGDTDLFTGGVHGFSLLRNDGKGKFADVTRAAGLTLPQAVRDEITVGGLWLDADADGDLDLFVTQYVKWTAEREVVCKTRGVRDYCHPRQYAPAANRYYRNDGDGRFSDQTLAAGLGAHTGKGMAAAAADYDRDGDLDIYVTNDRVPNFLFVNDGGRFTESALESGVALPSSGEAPSSMGVAFADLSADGLPDLFFTALADETFPLFVNAGDGFFDDRTYRSGLTAITQRMAGWSAIAVDFDNDGVTDLFVTRSDALAPDGGRAETARQTNSLFLGSLGGRFADASESSGLSRRPARMYRGAATGDLNGDGRLDLVVSALADNAEVCISSEPATGHWLGVRLDGGAGNRHGLGAKITVEAAGRRQVQTAGTVSGYASTSTAPVHFGLGAAKTVSRVTVEWLDGVQQTVEDVASGQVLTVRKTARR